MAPWSFITTTGADASGSVRGLPQSDLPTILASFLNIFLIFSPCYTLHGQAILTFFWRTNDCHQGHSATTQKCPSSYFRTWHGTTSDQLFDGMWYVAYTTLCKPLAQQESHTFPCFGGHEGAGWSGNHGLKLWQ